MDVTETIPDTVVVNGTKEGVFVDSRFPACVTLVAEDAMLDGTGV
jgi:hypothetical protein